MIVKQNESLKNIRDGLSIEDGICGVVGVGIVGHPAGGTGGLYKLMQAFCVRSMWWGVWGGKKHRCR